ncbi:MAG: hypothetical protein JSS82_00250 [Bacteroidetes bacterium]|nr:hypothetical protein [Bacteroidota bacterium]
MIIWYDFNAKYELPMSTYATKTVPYLQELWNSRADPTSNAYAYFTRKFNRPEIGSEKQMVILAAHFMLYNGMLCHAFRNRNEKTEGHRVILERYSMTTSLDHRKVLKDYLYATYIIGLYAPEHHESTRYRWTHDMSAADFMLLVDPGLPTFSRYTNSVNWPVHAVLNSQMANTFWASRWVNGRAVFPGHARLVKLGLDHLMLIFLRVVSDVIDHPIDVLRELFIYDTPKIPYLSRLYDRLSEKNDMLTELFSTVFVMTEFFLRRETMTQQSAAGNLFRQSELSRYTGNLVSACIRSLTHGLRMLLCENELGLNAHDLLRHHDCFWVNKLIPWIEVEEDYRRRFLENLNDRVLFTYFINEAIIETVRSLDSFFLLRLVGLDVHGLARRMKGRSHPTEPFLSRQALTGGPLALTGGFEIPDYRDPSLYSVTDAAFINRIRAYCESILAQIATHRYALHGKLLILGA